MVIGVSKYDYLPKNKEECNEESEEKSYGLCQLYVSALTAYNFFGWLKNKYRHFDLPLARVWLLLAPTDAEIQKMSDLPQNSYRQPTLANCEQAIEEWYTSIKTLNSFASEKSRTIFFFSGHGLEVKEDRQILLPSDYLKPPLKNVARALSTYNLWTGMGATPAPEHFFFLDACRNDHSTLIGLGIEGVPVLNPYPSKKAKDKAIFPIVYATGPGAVSFAYEDVKEGSSIFDKALLECLECVEGVQAWQDDQQRYWITFQQLEGYLEPRVAQLLQDAGSRLKQPVHIELGRRLDTPICEVVPAVPRRSSRNALETAMPALTPDSREAEAKDLPAALPALLVFAATLFHETADDAFPHGHGRHGPVQPGALDLGTNPAEVHGNESAG